MQGAQDNAIRRPREHSLFGVAEKRAPAPFRQATLSVPLAVCCNAPDLRIGSHVMNE